jgi:hypothetical protein
MNGPSEIGRQAAVAALQDLDETPDLIAEQRLLTVLEGIGEAIRSDIERTERELNSDSALDELGAIESWASVISAAVARVYAPTSPWKRRAAGWAKEVASRLRWLTNLLLTPLKAAAVALGAVSWSISMNFPWGVSVGLSWA